MKVNLKFKIFLVIGIFILGFFNTITISYCNSSEIMENQVGYDLVIISPDIFSSNIQPLIKHKNNHGIKTILKTTEEIYDEYQGRDKPEQIKYFIYEANKIYDIKYVLLIGNIKKLPIRKTEVNHIWPGWAIQTDDIITDLYYADIYDANGDFCSWDSNEDNVFSEYYLYNLGENYGEIVFIDEVDLYPDVGVGRIPCSNSNELETVINKIILYETQSNNDYFKNIILAGIDGFPEPGYQFELVTENIAPLMKDFNQVKLYESKNNINPSNINNEINKGAGFFICSSHGTPGSFHNYFKNNINSLKNERKLPIVFLNGCYCAQIDSTSIYNLQILLLSISLQIANNPNSNPVIIEYINNFRQNLNNLETNNLLDCIAWKLLKYENGGSIVSIGGVRSGTLLRNNPIGGFSGLFSIKFFESYNSGILISDMYNNAVSSFIDESWRNYVTLQRFILLGDPSLKVGGY